MTWISCHCTDDTIAQNIAMLAQIWDFLRTPSQDVHLPLVGNHGLVLTILATYLFLVKILGPRLMKNREPYDLRGVIRVYNKIQILYNLLMLAFCTHFMFGPGNFDFRCIRNLPMDHEYKNWERWLSYSYFLNKFVDMLETFFFILRKKDRQISFLHVFHHVYMVYMTFFYMHYDGYGGHGLFVVFWNMIVHSLMYIYYYQAALNRNSQAVLWWKKYMTSIQLLQFCIVLAHCIYTLRQPDCETARFSATICSIIALVFLILFINFYIRNYVLPKKKSS